MPLARTLSFSVSSATPNLRFLMTPTDAYAFRPAPQRTDPTAFDECIRTTHSVVAGAAR